MDNKTTPKKTFKIDNGVRETPFMLMLSLNGEEVKRHYFDCFGYVSNSLQSLEFLETMSEIVEGIKRDFESKSRAYLWYNRPEPIKLTGFANPEDATYIQCDARNPLVEKNEDEEAVFKFEFFIHKKLAFAHQWDGSAYPAELRIPSKIDLTNSDSTYRNVPQEDLTFSKYPRYYLNQGCINILYDAVNKIRNVIARDSNGNVLDYTYEMEYGKDAQGRPVVYQNRFINSDYVKGWREATLEKTNKYFGPYRHQRSVAAKSDN